MSDKSVCLNDFSTQRVKIVATIDTDIELSYTACMRYTVLTTGGQKSTSVMNSNKKLSCCCDSRSCCVRWCCLCGAVLA